MDNNNNNNNNYSNSNDKNNNRTNYGTSIDKNEINWLILQDLSDELRMPDQSCYKYPRGVA